MSTLTEQIAAVKDAIETYEAEALGYENGEKAVGGDILLRKAAAVYRRSEAVMRDVLATLEGMAAPGTETTRKPDVPCPVTGNDACEFGYCRETPGCYLKECGYPLRTGDSPSPQQPTPDESTKIARLTEALEQFQSYGCPVCHSDCASANPPVMACPMQMAMEALR